MNLKQVVQAFIAFVGLAVPLAFWRKLEELIPPHRGQFLVLILWAACVSLAAVAISRHTEARNLRKEIADVTETTNRQVSRHMTLQLRLTRVHGMIYHEKALSSDFPDWFDALISVNDGPTATLNKAEGGTALDYPHISGLPTPPDNDTVWESARCMLAGIQNRQFDRR